VPGVAGGKKGGPFWARLSTVRAEGTNGGNVNSDGTPAAAANGQWLSTNAGGNGKGKKEQGVNFRGKVRAAKGKGTNGRAWRPNRGNHPWGQAGKKKKKDGPA